VKKFNYEYELRKRNEDYYYSPHKYIEGVNCIGLHHDSQATSLEGVQLESFLKTVNLSSYSYLDLLGENQKHKS